MNVLFIFGLGMNVHTLASLIERRSQRIESFLRQFIYLNSNMTTLEKNFGWRSGTINSHQLVFRTVVFDSYFFMVDVYAQHCKLSSS